MEKNNQYDILLLKYLLNEANADERSFVESWINENSENLLHFKKLEAAWQLAGAKSTLDHVLNEMNINEKWNRFKHHITPGENDTVFDVQEQNKKESFGEYPQRKKPRLYKMFIAVAVAASVILVIVWAFPFFTREQAAGPAIVQNKVKQMRQKISSIRHELNTTGKDKRMMLPDGSLIVLADKSEITYPEEFTMERNITLTGKAYFKVTKKASSPFTVSSGDISTTALGTEFTVTAFENTTHIIIRLYEGKVVVKALDKANKKLKNNVYLLPGQAFVYHSEAAPNVKAFELTKDEVPEEILNGEMFNDNDPSLPQNDEGSWYMFNNQPLAHVLDQLSQMYHVQINYDKTAVQNIYFTRKYNETQSIDEILKEVALLNNLTVSKNDTVFVINR